MHNISELTSPESEAGVVATLVHHPEYAYYSENLIPEHFTQIENKIMYTAIKMLAEKGIFYVDAFNIFEILNSSDATKHYTSMITIEQLNEFIATSESLARNTIEEYQICAKNVFDASFRVEAVKNIRECEELCFDHNAVDIEQKIYALIDSIMTEYSYVNEIPLYKDVIEENWEKVKARQGDGYAGIPFKFPHLNEYATIENGELFIFAAEAKQGKSMMLMNCAVDLLKRDLAVLYIDSELNTRLFTARLIAHLTGIEYKRITSGNYTEDEEKLITEKIEWIKTKKLVHIYLPMFDKQSVYTAVKKIKHTMGLDVLIIDYFKSSGEGDAFNTYQELGAFVDMIKNKICGDMDICGIGAAQATVTGKVADSARIGRNASTIALITDKTQDEIEADGVECGNKKLRVVLNRNGMQMAENEYIDLKFDGNHILYEEAKQHIPQEPF